jgi:hypothetical protein
VLASLWQMALIAASPASAAALAANKFDLMLDYLAATTSASGECHAATPTALAACLASSAANRVVIDSDIDCGAGADCRFRLVERQGPFELLGTGSDRPGIYRRPGYRGRFGLSVDNASGPITISHLIFDEGGNRPVGAPGGVWTNAACRSPEECNGATLAIQNSRNVTIADAAFRSAHNIGLGVSGSSGITIRGSEFTGSWVYGLWFAQAPPSSDVHIIGNIFRDIRSNAIMISAAPPPTNSPCQYNTIVGNLLSHNHRAAYFHVCGPTHDRPCGGGQIDVEHHANRVLLFGNRIRNGEVDEDTSVNPRPPVAGIEIAPEQVHDVLILRNHISDVTGHGIALDWPTSDVEGIWTIDNQFERVGGHNIDSVERASGGPPDWGRCEGVPPAASIGGLR